MKVVLSTIRKDHIFDLARQLHKREMLAALFTGYPMFRLQHEGLPTHVIRSFPWLQTMYMARGRFGLHSLILKRELEWWAHKTLDAFAERNLPECDVFYGFAGCGLRSGRRSQKQNGVYVCDRPNSHIRYQDHLLQEEFERHGVYYQKIESRIIDQEEAEYAAADFIVVPSEFARCSFLEMGCSPSKIRVIPYGVNLSRFHPVARPDDKHFEALYVGSVSLRKGIPYLLEAFSLIQHPQKRLTIVGSVLPETERFMKQFIQEPIDCIGACPQPKLKEIMSRSHVLVLPSIEDGFGLVMAEAMACGCPVIATTSTGAIDLFQNEIEGFIVPPRDAAALANRMQRLADDPDLQKKMSSASLKRVETLGGWDAYGEAMVNFFSAFTKQTKTIAV